MSKRIILEKNNLSKLFVITCFIILAIACSGATSRVIKKTDTEAIIHGIGNTKIEAQINAEKRAKEIFPNYTIIGKPDFSQDYHVSADKNSASGRSYWSCVLKIHKK